MKLHWQIFIALALAVVIGSLTSGIHDLLGINLIPFYEFFGTLFS